MAYDLTKLQAVQRAANLLQTVRAVYANGKELQAMLALYQVGSDPAFNAAVNALFSSAERTELNAMLVDVNTLVTTWETLHRGAVGL